MKKKLIPSFQLAMLAGAAGWVTNQLLQNIREMSQIEENAPDAAESFDPTATVATPTRRAVGGRPIEREKLTAEAERFVEGNCPYLHPEGENDVRFYITQSTNVGRYPHNDICLENDMSVSREHCRIFVKGGRYYVVDMDAKKKSTLDGVIVDNKRDGIDALYQHELKDGSRLTIGNGTYIFCNRPNGGNDFARTLSDCDSTICD